MVPLPYVYLNMKSRSFFQLLLFLLVLSSCSEKETVPKLEQGVALITGQVSNLGEYSMTIRFAADGVVEKIEHTAIIDSSGNFRAELELYHPQIMHMYFKKRLVKLYLRPTDSIHLEIDERVFARESLPVFEISGTEPDAEISREIQQYLRFCGENSSYPDPKGLTVDEYLNELRKEINRQDSVLESFCLTTEVTADFKSWAKCDIRYDIANYLISYRFANQGYKGELFDKGLFPVNNDEAIISTLYPLHLRHYALNLGIWQDTITLNLLKNNKNYNAYQRSLQTVINQEEEGLSRDIMCYKLLQSLFAESSEDFKKLSAEMDNYIANETLKSALREKEELLKKQKDYHISFLDPGTDEEREITGDFWKVFNDKYKGKIVYMDIWATWCSPCRTEIPHAIELHEYFHGKEIVFVNLCLASNEIEWKTMVEQNGIKGDNYFFNKDQTQITRDKLKFQGYPTYMIIDRQGNIVNRNAPRPSSGDEIRKLLKEWIERDNP